MTKTYTPLALTVVSKWTSNPVLAKAVSVFAGTALLALTAQLSFHLPFTPVPITGQTFGVALLALLWGRKQAVACFLLYILEGAVGLPVFANAQAYLKVGPTLGYLFGMLVTTWIVGGLADRGAANSFSKALVCCYVGSAITFVFGLAGLSFFVPGKELLYMGLLPFLPGDLIKNLFAAALASKLNSYANK